MRGYGEEASTICFAKMMPRRLLGKSPENYPNTIAAYFNFYTKYLADLPPCSPTLPYRCLAQLLASHRPLLLPSSFALILAVLCIPLPLFNLLLVYFRSFFILLVSNSVLILPLLALT